MGLPPLESSPWISPWILPWISLQSDALVRAVHFFYKTPTRATDPNPDTARPCKLCFELYVEGATSAAAVPDLDPDNTQGHTNFQERLAQYGNVEVVRSDTLSSFARACSTDILITGKSGYSYLMSLLCETPVVLAFPFWHSYKSVPNAMMVHTVGRDEKWIDGATINVTRFQYLAEQQGLACGRGRV